VEAMASSIDYFEAKKCSTPSSQFALSWSLAFSL